MQIQNCEVGVLFFEYGREGRRERKNGGTPAVLFFSISLVHIMFLPLGNCQRHQKGHKITLSTSIFIQSSSSCSSVFLSVCFPNSSFPDCTDKKDSLRKDKSEVIEKNEFNLSKNQSADHKPPALTERLVNATNHRPLIAIANP